MASITIAPPVEARDSFACFGGHAAVLVMGHGSDRTVAATRKRLEDWHRRFSRFEASSELSLLNASPRRRVRVSDLMCRFVGAAVDAAWRTHGLVDPTLLDEIEVAGY